MVAYSREVEVPLSTSKKIVVISADNYDTEFALKQYVSGYIFEFFEFIRVKTVHETSLL